MTARASRVLIYPILLLGLALRLYRLGAASLWYDETVSVWLARQDLAEITRHTAGDIHPPLYYYLLHFWGLATGWTEFAAAFFSLVCGVLLIALGARAARDWLGARAAVVGALLIALSPYNVWYSQEVRMYTLGALLGLGSAYCAVRTLRAWGKGERSTGYLAAYVLLAASGLYTLYYFIFLLAFQALAGLVWLVRQERVAARDWLLANAAIALLYLPWLPTALRQVTDPPVPPWRGFVPLDQVLLSAFSALSLGQAIDPLQAWPVLLAVALVVMAALVGRRQYGQRARWAAPLLLGYAFGPVLLLGLLSYWKPLYHVRYVFTYSPAFYLLVAYGLVLLDGWKRPPGHLLAAGVGLALLGGSALSLDHYWNNPQYAADDLRGAVSHLAENWREGDAVLIDAGYAYPALLYFDQPVATRVRLSDYRPQGPWAQSGAVVLTTGSIGGSPSLGWGDPQSDFYRTTEEETTAALGRVFAAHPRVWVLRIYDTVVDPQGVIRKYLDTHGALIDETVYTGEANTRVLGYVTNPQGTSEPPSGATIKNVRLGDRVTLVAVEGPPGTLRAGESLSVVLYWRAEQSLSLNYHTSVQVTDARNRKWGQADEAPLGNALPTTRWRVGQVYREPVRVALDPQMPEAKYTVRVILYNPNTGETVGQVETEISSQ